VFLGKSSWIFALRTRLLERFVSEHRRMVTDAGVLQEFFTAIPLSIGITIDSPCATPYIWP
jgi:hypothetical protein